MDEIPRGEIKRRVLTLVVGIIVLDAAAIGLYYGFHISERAIKTQETFVAVWVVLTLLVVATLMKPIREMRRRVVGRGSPRR